MELKPQTTNTPPPQQQRVNCMELKLAQAHRILIHRIVLIVPYGIET